MHLCFSVAFKGTDKYLEKKRDEFESRREGVRSSIHWRTPRMAVRSGLGQAEASSVWVPGEGGRPSSLLPSCLAGSWPRGGAAGVGPVLQGGLWAPRAAASPDGSPPEWLLSCPEPFRGVTHTPQALSTPALWERQGLLVLPATRRRPCRSRGERAGQAGS